MSCTPPPPHYTISFSSSARTLDKIPYHAAILWLSVRFVCSFRQHLGPLHYSAQMLNWHKVRILEDCLQMTDCPICLLLSKAMAGCDTYHLCCRHHLCHLPPILLELVEEPKEERHRRQQLHTCSLLQVLWKLRELLLDQVHLHVDDVPPSICSSSLTCTLESCWLSWASPAIDNDSAILCSSNFCNSLPWWWCFCQHCTHTL